jgi:hypothetical protein
MPSRADFYVGRGYDAEWIGSVAWDGYPPGIPKKVLEAEDEASYRREVLNFMKRRSDGATPDGGWPWPWNDSAGTTYTYAFDGTKVWASCYGSSWWAPPDPEPDRKTLRRKAANFPDMSMRRKLADDGSGERVLVVKDNRQRKKKT